MPYTTIYKTIDGKWHCSNCVIVRDTHPEDVIESRVIGSTATKPQPNLNDLCEDCFSFMFDENK